MIGEHANIKVSNLETGEEILTFTAHSKRVNALDFTPDGTKVISASADKTLKLWNLETSEVITTFTGDSGFNTCVITPDGLIIVAGDILGRLHFLHLEG
ncbi:MAG: hypothetical protein F6K09_28015 [Merismopedia sp. SIO2A8]|nr:hypothetical protein [Merismopedia sp. SIO2A8]